MAKETGIEWTDSSWNPVTGCDKLSAGCQNCYAEALAERFRGIEGHAFENGFDLQLHYDRLDAPFKWGRNRRIFVNSMSDLFHEDIPFSFIEKVFETMVEADFHTFQILTKRSDRLLELADDLPWPENVWMGVTIENMDTAYRLDNLKQTPARIKFLSCEPLLGPINGIGLDAVDWVIVGGESGPRAREMKKEWVVDLRDRCNKKGIDFFFKQWSGVRKSKVGRELEGRTWDQMPDRPTCQI